MKKAIGAAILFTSLAACSSVYPSEKNVILNRESYFSVFTQYGNLRYDPELLVEGKFSARQLGRIKKTAKRFTPGIKTPGPEAWKQYAYVGRLTTRLTPTPPSTWNNPDFDDSDWPRRRDLFLAEGRGIIKAFLRTWIEVKDPSGPMTLNMTFRGGAKVYLNGREIASSHIKDGRAPAYPAEAYKALLDELHPSRKKTTRGAGPHVGRFMKSFENASPYRYKNETLSEWRYAPGILKAPVQKQTWDRILNQRNNRKIGPLVLPKEHLKKGANLLAIELIVADCHPSYPTHPAKRGASDTWPHIDLTSIEVKAAPAVATSTLARGGPRIWAEDIHMRVYSPDYLPAGTRSGTVRMVGARGGSYGGQIVLGTDRKLSGLSVTVSELKQVKSGSGTIPSKRVDVFYMRPHPLQRILEDLTLVGRSRSIESEASFAALRYGPPQSETWKMPNDMRKKKSKALLQSLNYYDHLTPAAPATVAANACQPIWISVRVPEDAAPGMYEGGVTVKAGGGFAQTIPLKIEVVNWQLPSIRDYSTLVWAEHNPYGVAARYKVKPWSDEHLKMVEGSLAQLSRISSDVLIVPVLCNTEFGNKEDSPIRWIRRKDGSLGFDFTNLDKYLNLAVKHGGTPKCILFHILHGGTFNAKYVMVTDEASGKSEKICLGSNTDPVDNHREAWGQFAASLYNHMRARGLHRSMYWGLEKDMSTYPALLPLLAEFAPNVKWAMTTHIRLTSKYHKLVSDVYAQRKYVGAKKSSNGLWLGWRSPQLSLSNSRGSSRGYFLLGYHPPFVHRPWAERILSRNYRGIGRFGADHWGVWHTSFPASVGTCVGFGIMNILWPGKSGPEGSTRLEIMREGLQEAEVKIFLERAVDSGLVDKDLSQKIGELILKRYNAVGHLQQGPGDPYCNSDNHQGWHGRSRELYRMAAQVAGKIDVAKLARQKPEQAAESAAGLSLLLDRESFKVPAETITKLSFALHNNSTEPVDWKAVPDQSWLSMSPPTGRIDAGRVQMVNVQLKPQGAAGSKLEAGIAFQDKAGKTLSAARIPLTLGVKPKALPKGKRIALSALPKKITYEKVVPRSSKDKKMTFHKNQALLMKPAEAITFKLEGAGIKAFSANVVFDGSVGLGGRHAGVAKMGGMYCQVFVDGKLREKSPILTLKNKESHLVVITGLEKAKTLKIVSHNERNGKLNGVLSWLEATFYTAEKGP